MEAVERRAMLLILAVALLLAFYAPTNFTTETGRWWEVAVYLLGIASVGAAGVLLVLAIAPQQFFRAPQDLRERLLFFAFALVVADVVAIAVLRGYSVYYLHRHGFPGRP
jgi:hypothetical protein